MSIKFLIKITSFGEMILNNEFDWLKNKCIKFLILLFIDYYYDLHRNYVA